MKFSHKMKVLSTFQKNFIMGPPSSLLAGALTSVKHLGLRIKECYLTSTSMLGYVTYSY